MRVENVLSRFSQCLYNCWSMAMKESLFLNDLTIGWQNWNLLHHPNATLAPQVRQARPSGEILNYSLSHYSDILNVRSLLFLLFLGPTNMLEDRRQLLMLCSSINLIKLGNRENIQCISCKLSSTTPLSQFLQD